MLNSVVGEFGREQRFAKYRLVRGSEPEAVPKKFPRIAGLNCDEESLTSETGLLDAKDLLRSTEILKLKQEIIARKQANYISSHEQPRVVEICPAESIVGISGPAVVGEKNKPLAASILTFLLLALGV